ncbi:MAG TPA: hypothetical protein VH120_15260, partial [Gemmataceae bacterium]|nr:hypothetical protein [Gemmataceae bacterium]
MGPAQADSRFAILANPPVDISLHGSRAGVSEGSRQPGNGALSHFPGIRTNPATAAAYRLLAEIPHPEMPRSNAL